MSAGQVNHTAPARLTFVLGGARSGKSRAAEALVMQHPPPWCYIATAQTLDDEMRERIARHRRARAPGWHTTEEPIALPDALHAAAGRPALVDCLTLWVTNLLLAAHDIAAATESLLAALHQRPAPTVLVANETGLGIVPDNALARRFRDAAGVLNQRVAAQSDRVLFMVAGLAMTVK